MQGNCDVPEMNTAMITCGVLQDAVFRFAFVFASQKTENWNQHYSKWRKILLSLLKVYTSVALFQRSKRNVYFYRTWNKHSYNVTDSQFGNCHVT